MTKQSEYQPPLVQPERNIKKLIKKIKGDFEVLLHGIRPHQGAKFPEKKFNNSNFASDDEYLYQTVFDIYRESCGRISSLEEKAFKLLTYISAVSAVLIYFLSQEISGLYRIIVIISIILLSIAIIISLRCIGIKQQMALYINTVFNFAKDSEPTTRDKKSIMAEVISSAVFNHNVADNTADILRASRMMLIFGILTTIISSVFFLANSGQKKDKIYRANVTLLDSTFIKSAKEQDDIQNTLIQNMKHQIISLKTDIDSMTRHLK